jgi:branched-chain amino acid transport system substrate-binding protein
MRQGSARYISGFGALLSFGTVLLGCGAEAPAGGVEVAVAVPFAGTGLMAEARQAWELELEQVNAHGGINGRALKVHERDTPLSDAADLQPVADGFVDLTGEGYRYIISLVSGTAVEPMMNAAMPNGVLAMSITSEDSAANLPAYDGMLLRGILPTDRLLEKQAATMQADGLVSIAIVGETTAGQRDSRHEAMQRAYASCTACTVTEVTYPAEADLYLYDWEGVGKAAMAGKPDVVFLSSTNPSALADTVRWIDASGYTGLYYFAYGAYMAAVTPAFVSDVPQHFRSYDLALPPSTQLDQFLALYAERYGDTLVPEPRLLAFADYLTLLALAMTEVGDADAHRVAASMREIAGPPGEVYGPMEYAGAVAALRAGRDIDFTGFSGPLDFDARGDVSDGFILQYGVTAAGDVAPLP